MLSDKVSKIAMIDEVPGLYQMNPLVTLAIELALKMLANRCSRFNADIASNPNWFDRRWLWSYVKSATKDAANQMGRNFDYDLAVKIYDKLIKAGSNATQQDIQDIINELTK